jgi:hypothetical protein
MPAAPVRTGAQPRDEQCDVEQQFKQQLQLKQQQLKQLLELEQ